MSHAPSIKPGDDFHTAEYERILRSMSADEVALMRRADPRFKVPRSQFSHIKDIEAREIASAVKSEGQR